MTSQIMVDIGHIALDVDPRKLLDFLGLKTNYPTNKQTKNVDLRPVPTLHRKRISPLKLIPPPYHMEKPGSLVCIDTL